MVDKGRITSDLRSIEDDEERGARRLFLIRHIRMPCNTTVSVCEEAFEFAIAAVAVYEVDLRITLGRTAGLASY